MVRLLPGGHRVMERGFYRNASRDFQTRLVLGRAAHGASDVGEVLATVARIGSRAAWIREWSVTAERVEAGAAAARTHGHLVSAASGYLRAATYWGCVVDELTTSAKTRQLRPVFERHRNCWEAFVDCSDGAFVRINVPYEDTTLPGYLLRPDATGAVRPTLVMTNGSDGAICDMWGAGAAGALARGWNAFVYDGPGQQSMLFMADIPFRPDWEAVLTPVVDTLATRSDVDTERLTAYAISQAGFWLPRALAFEHRFVAAVADPGVVDVSTSWTRPLSKSMRTMLEKGDRAAFNRAMRTAMRIPSLRRTLTFRSRPYRHQDWFDLYMTVQAYRLDEQTASTIATPLLITDPDQEQFWPGQSKRLAALVPGRADLVRFTAREGANFHCQPMGRLLTEQRMFDWLDQFVR